MRVNRLVPRLPELVILLVITALHAPALLGGTYFLDVYLTEVHPHLEAVRASLSDGTLPWWSSGLLLGYPLAANPQVGALYLPHLGLLLAGFDAHQTLVISVWTHSLLAAFGALGVARRLGASDAGATAAGVIYGAAPFLVFYHQAIHGLIALAFLPWILRAGWELGRGESPRRWFVLGTLFTALALYGGHIQIVLYAGAAALPAAWIAAERERWRGTLSVAGFGAAALLLYGPQLVPAAELWGESLRRALSPADVVAALDLESLGLDDAVELVLPRFFGGPSRNDFWYPEFLGAPVLLAAGLAVAKRDRASRLLATLLGAGLAVLIVVRIPGVGEWLVGLPGLRVFRAPGRVFVWMLVAAAGLAGLGVDRLATAGRKWLWIGLGVLVATGGAVALGALDGVPARDEALMGAAPTLRRWDGLWLALSALGLGAALVVPEQGRRWAVAVAVAWPVVAVGARYAPTVPVVRVPPAVTFLKTASPGRILGVSAGDDDYLASVPGPGGWPYSATGDAERAGATLAADVGLTYGLESLHAQTSLPLRRTITRVFGETKTLAYPFQQEPPYDPALLAHLGVTHVVTKKGGQMPVSPRPRTVFERSGVLIHEIAERRARGRFYPLTAVAGVSSEAAALAAVRRTGATPDLPLVVEGVAAGTVRKGALPTDLDLGRPGPGAFRVAVDATEPGVVLIVENAYPGWEATVDGQPADVLVADGAFLGVRVPAGAHAVTLEFHPRGRLLGWLLFAAGLAIVAAGARLRRAPESSPDQHQQS